VGCKKPMTLTSYWNAVRRFVDGGVCVVLPGVAVWWVGGTVGECEFYGWSCCLYPVSM